VLFENLADPIITGREELGMPKLFCDIAAKVEGDTASISLAWRGAQFGEIKVSGLSTPPPPPATNGEPAQRMPGPPPPPPEQGQFAHRYVPAVGQPGKADADYAVFIPNPKPASDDAKPQTLTTATASASFEARDWQSLPTIHHVAKGLAEMPIYGVEEAKVVKGQGVSDVGAAERIE
jgi:hypothetical protein